MEEIVRLNPECIPCLLGTQLERYPKDIENQVKIQYMQRVLEVIASATMTTSAPMIVREISKIQREMFGTEVDYSEDKRYFNQMMLEKEQQIQARIEEAKDSFQRAVQYAIIGNFIDFGAMKSVDEQKLAQFLDDADVISLNEQEYANLQLDVEKAEKIVYLTDNCGEIVMDKCLIRELQKKNPQAEITVMVRGVPVLNDATMEDAVQVGIDKLVNVMGNGSDVAGTCLEELSQEAKQKILEADVILAKGQGNFETMQKCGLNVYYIFMCKCEMFARLFQVPRFTGMLLNDRNCV